MNNNTTDRDLYLEADKDWHLTIPPYLASRYGTKPGTRVYVNELNNGLYLLRPVTQLAKLYLEPTSLCNLNCRTCIRNVWNEPMGNMSETV